MKRKHNGHSLHYRTALVCLCFCLVVPIANLNALDTSISVSTSPIALGVGMHISNGTWEGDFAAYTSALSALLYQVSRLSFDTDWAAFRDSASAIGGEAGFRYDFTRSETFVFSGGVSLIGVAAFPREGYGIMGVLAPQLMFEFPLKSKKDSLYFRTVIPVLYCAYAPNILFLGGFVPPAFWPMGGFLGLFFGYRHTF